LLPHPPYRPDLAPSDFFLFQNSKNIWKESVSISLLNQKMQQKHGLQISL
jgi:hypothetical protein